MSKRKGRRSPPAPSPGSPSPTTPTSGGSASPALLASAVVLALLCAAAAAFWLLDLGQPQAQPTPTIVPPVVQEKPAEWIEASGRMLVPIDAALSMVELPGRAIREIVQGSRSGAVTSAQWTPDGRTVAYAYYHLRSGDSASSSEIFLVDPGGEPKVLVERDRPGTVIESPAWSPDGRSLYFSFSALQGQRLVRRIERFDLSSGSRTAITNGVMPAASPDGQSLAFVRADVGGDGLAVSAADGGNGRTLIPSGRFSAVGPPRFSPDGRQLAVPLSAPVGQAVDPSPAFPFGLLGARIAFAHGDPWELYLLDVTGGEPKRLTHLVEDEISVAWSPTGDQLAVYGPRGLYLVRLDGTTILALDRGGFGGIDWAP